MTAPIDNLPTAGLINIESYEALPDEIEDLRIESIARKRLQNFDKSKSISYTEMVKKFEHQAK